MIVKKNLANLDKFYQINQMMTLSVVPASTGFIQKSSSVRQIFFSDTLENFGDTQICRDTWFEKQCTN